jgi:hypothetical protein
MDFRTDAACQSNLRNFQQPCLFYFCVCFITAGVFVLLLQDLLQSCSRWGGEPEWRTCAMRDDEPSVLCVCVFLLLQDLLQSCSRCQLCVFYYFRTYYKDVS